MARYVTRRPSWPNTGCYGKLPGVSCWWRPREQLLKGRPNVVTAVAIRSEKVVAAAGASTDSDALWQIGIDVQSEHRGRGLGAVLTSRVASAVLARGKVPFYGSRVDNIASRRTAHSAGFYPSWVAVYTTDE